MAQNEGVVGDATDIAAVRVFRSQMPFAYQTSAVEIATAALEKCGAGQGGALDLKQVAGAIKQEYDKRYPGTGKATDGVYHCVVGDHFACGFTKRYARQRRPVDGVGAASHEYRQHIWLKWRHLNIVLWKSKDCPFHVNDA